MEEEILVEETENADELTAEEEVREDAEVETGDENNQEKSEVDTKADKEEKLFTQEEVNEILSKRVARKEARLESRLRKEYEEKYGQLERVVNAGLGTDNVEEATSKLSDFYERKGIKVPPRPEYSDRDIEILAEAEANEIISSGYEDVKDEVERLARKDLNTMSKSEKLIFKKLADERKRMEDEQDLASIGISKSAIEDADFKEFEKNLNPSLSLKKKYEMYQQTKPKKEVTKIGSMTGTKENKVKDYYSPEEIERLSDEDLDNEQVWEAVRRSMTSQS